MCSQPTLSLFAELTEFGWVTTDDVILPPTLRPPPAAAVPPDVDAGEGGRRETPAGHLADVSTTSSLLCFCQSNIHHKP